MNDDSADEDSARERRLDELIAEFYSAEERGVPLEPAAFVADHPDFAPELESFFGDLEGVRQAMRRDSAPLEETRDSDGAGVPRRSPGSIVRYFGEYEILDELGSGGMGIVYRARHRKLRRIVALKMIKAAHLATSDEIRRFETEIRAAARLSHPGIVSVLEVGLHDGQRFYAMEYVDGGSLSTRHRDEPLTGRAAAEAVRALAEAVEYAHAQGIVHRDLKPSNVLLTAEGRPRIVDFGLAKRLWTDDESATEPNTESGQILGTAGYMAPEQAAGKSRLVGSPADIYGLGAVLYALLTGRAPFLGESQSDTILQVIHREPVSPRALNPGIARDLETICLKCLEKEPHRRYGTAGLLADDLTRLLEGRPVAARPIGRLARGARWCLRNRALAGLAFLALLIALVSPILAASMYRLAGEREAARKEATENARKLASALRSEREASGRIEGALTKERQARAELAKALNDKESALTDSLSKTRQLARRNRALLLQEAPDLWARRDLRSLRKLLDEAAAESPGTPDFVAAYWASRLRQTEPIASLSLPKRKEFVFSRSGRLAALLAVHPEDVQKPEHLHKREVLELYDIRYDAAASPPLRFSHRRRIALTSRQINPRMAFLPDERALALAMGDGPAVHLVDLDSGEISPAFRTEYSMYGMAHFSATGSHLIKYDGDEDRWELWSLADHTRRQLPKRDDFGQQSLLSLSDDGTLVASENGLVVRVDDGAVVADLPSNGSSILFSSDNRYAAGAGVFWRLADDKEVVRLPEGGLTAFLPSEPGVALAVSQGELYRVDLERGVVSKRNTVGRVAKLALLSTPEAVDSQVVVGVEGDSLVAWRLQQPPTPATLRLGQIRAASRNRRFVVARSQEIDVYEVWDLFDRKKLADFDPPDLGPPDSTPAAIQTSARRTFAVSDAGLVAFTSDLRQVTLFDPRRNEFSKAWSPKTTTSDGAFKSAYLTPDGTTKLLGEAGALHGRDVATGEEWVLIPQPPVSRFALNVRISPDSRWAAVGRTVWNLQDRTVRTLPASIADASQFNDRWVVLDGRTLLAGELGTFYDPAKDETLEFVAPRVPYATLAVSPDGRSLATLARRENRATVSLYAIAGDDVPPRLLPLLEFDASSASESVFTPDGLSLILIDHDGRVEFVGTSEAFPGSD